MKRWRAVLSVQSSLARCCINLRRMLLNILLGLVFVYIPRSFKPPLLSYHHLCHLLSESTGARRIELESQCHRWRIARLFSASHSLDETQTKHAGYAKVPATALSQLTAQVHRATTAPSRPTSRPAQRLKEKPHDHSHAVCPCLRKCCGDAERHSRSAAAPGATLDLANGAPAERQTARLIDIEHRPTSAAAAGLLCLSKDSVCSVK